MDHVLSFDDIQRLEEILEMKKAAVEEVIVSVQKGNVNAIYIIMEDMSENWRINRLP